MTKLSEFTGHSSRVLHMDQSPDGSMVVSAAADETLRFWNVFGAPPRRARSPPRSRASLPFLPSLNSARAATPDAARGGAARGSDSRRPDRRARWARWARRSGERDGEALLRCFSPRRSRWCAAARPRADDDKPAATLRPRGFFQDLGTRSPRQVGPCVSSGAARGHRRARARAVESAFRSALTKPEANERKLSSAWPSPHTALEQEIRKWPSPLRARARGGI